MYSHHHEIDHGRTVLITAPTAPAVSLADAKSALGIDAGDTSQDVLVEAAIAAASDALDPAAGGWLGRALRPQTWELQLHSFGGRHGRFHFHPGYPISAHHIALPYPPLIAVVSVKYLDVNGADQILALGTGYRVLGMRQPYGKASIAPLYATSWPVPRIDDASVRIQFTCGYDDTDTIMPGSLKSAIILGARALMSVTGRDMLLLEDRVEGLGWKKFQNNPAAADIVNKAVKSLLINLAIS